MYIEELKTGQEWGVDHKEEGRAVKALNEDEEVVGKEVCGVRKVSSNAGGSRGVLVWDAKRVLVGAGARVLFYPTLLYNVVRNKAQAEFRWWDWIDEFVLLGAIPFQSDVVRLKELGVGGVVTLNEPYETLVPSSLYHDHGIRHLNLPTRDYLFAPSMADISCAVDFIHENALCGSSTYVHCKAGRGRSTTVVICYLVKYKHMRPDAAYGYVKSIRPRVLLASAQWQAVMKFYHLRVRNLCSSSDSSHPTSIIPKSLMPLGARNILAFDDGSVVVITKADLDGYDPSSECVRARDELFTNLSVIYRLRVASESALTRLSCLWLRCHTQGNMSSAQEFNGSSSCLISGKQLGGLTVDIHVYS